MQNELATSIVTESTAIAFVAPYKEPYETPREKLAGYVITRSGVTYPSEPGSSKDHNYTGLLGSVRNIAQSLVVSV